MALPQGALGCSAVCDCGISSSYSLTSLKAAHSQYPALKSGKCRCVCNKIVEIPESANIQKLSLGKYACRYIIYLTDKSTIE